MRLNLDDLRSVDEVSVFIQLCIFNDVLDYAVTGGYLSKCSIVAVEVSGALGADKELSRLEGKTFLYAIILLALYVVCIIAIVTNFLNLRLKKKLLSIINLFCGWIMAILLLIFLIFF